MLSSSVKAKGFSFFHSIETLYINGTHFFLFALGSWLYLIPQEYPLASRASTSWLKYAITCKLFPAPFPHINLQYWLMNLFNVSDVAATLGINLPLQWNSPKKLQQHFLDSMSTKSLILLLQCYFTYNVRGPKTQAQFERVDTACYWVSDALFVIMMLLHSSRKEAGSSGGYVPSPAQVCGAVSVAGSRHLSPRLLQLAHVPFNLCSTSRMRQHWIPDSDSRCWHLPSVLQMAQAHPPLSFATVSQLAAHYERRKATALQNHYCLLCWLHNGATSSPLTSRQQKLYTSSVADWKLICWDIVHTHKVNEWKINTISYFF